ncbi:MAG: hypothetical protein M3O01_05330 [Pseudomonadota bacterium]|nr:hypothetical protein [Pseudomonadota bacterium]
MPICIFSRTPRAATPPPRSPANVAEEIAQAEMIDRSTLWPTLRIRFCLRLRARPTSAPAR